MPAKRGKARQSFTRKRVKRYRTKWTHHVIPERLKLSLPRMWTNLEPEIVEYVDVEDPVEDELLIKGVPTEEWPYYMGFSKRMLALYWKYTGATLESEKTSLIEEYKLRGYQEHILLQLQDRVHYEGHFHRFIFEDWNYPDPPDRYLFIYERWTA